MVEETAGLALSRGSRFFLKGAGGHGARFRTAAAADFRDARPGGDVRSGFRQQVSKDLHKFNLGFATTVLRSVSEASDGLKNDLRAQVLAAGLGQRVANTWQNKGRMGGKTLYPEFAKARRRKSLDFVAFI